MPPRILALVLLLAVLPTFELAEQIEHAILHVVDGDAPDHLAHHEEGAGDEHGCTGLVHLCACHHAPVVASHAIALRRSVFASHTTTIVPPGDLVDLNSLEPPNRPPIA